LQSTRVIDQGTYFSRIAELLRHCGVVILVPDKGTCDRPPQNFDRLHNTPNKHARPIFLEK